MCGIIGIIAKTPVAPELVGGLKRLEYRGYASAGIATLIDGRLWEWASHPTAAPIFPGKPRA